MYEATDDPYCYPGTSVLRNRLDLREQAALGEFEALMSAQRAEEALAIGDLDVDGYRAIHRHLFGDVYEWAGEFRTVRIAKSGSMFCYPENISREMLRVFKQLEKDGLRGLDENSFAAKAAHSLAELNAIHPFREGNGRTQNTFLGVLAERAGHPIDLTQLEPDQMHAAMVESFNGDESRLGEIIAGLILRA